MMNLDTSTEFGARAEKRLREEAIIWLVTTSADGTPQPSPVWFWWDGNAILIHSEPDKPKIKNIRRDSHVALHFNSDADGGNIVVFTGTAEIDTEAATAPISPEYVEKYREGIKQLGLDEATMVATYSAIIRVTPAKVRGF